MEAIIPLSAITNQIIGTKKPQLSGFFDVTCRLSFLQRRETGGRPRILTR